MIATSELVQLVSSLAWPVAAVVILFILTSQRGRLLLRPIFGRLRKVSGPGGWGVELSEDAAAETKADVEGAIGSYAPALDLEFERLAYAEGVRGRLETAVREGLCDRERNTPGFRATVHIEDALVRNALYQLTDYWPSGSGKGRRFSVRFGMLGRSWRLGRSLYAPEVPDTESQLIEEWGMTRAQAATAAAGRRSFVCVLLRDRGQPVGILFMDAIAEHAFDDGVELRFDEREETRDLAAAVGRVRAAIARKGPGLKLLADD
jgi:hypothetical protein